MAEHAEEKLKTSARDRLIQAAQALAQERPFDDITIDDIIKAASLSRPAFYYHFAGGKEELRSVLVQRGVLDEVPSLDTGKAILEAALRVFARSGIQAATFEDIATEAGVTRGAVAWHFHSKDELLAGIMKQYGPHFAIRQVQEKIDQLLERDACNEEEIFRLLAGAFYDGFTLQSDIARLAILVIYSHPEVATLLSSKITSGRKQIVEYIQQRQSEGHFREKIDANLFVQVIASTFAMRAIGCGLYDLLPFSHLSREEAIEQLVSLLLFGMVQRDN